MTKNSASPAPAKKAKTASAAAAAKPKVKAKAKAASGDGAEKKGRRNRRRQSNKLSSYIQRIIGENLFDGHKKSSVSAEARSSMNRLAVGFVTEMAEICKTLTEQRNAKTAGADQVHYAARLIFSRADMVDRPDPSMKRFSNRAEIYYEEKTKNFKNSRV